MDSAHTAISAANGLAIRRLPLDLLQLDPANARAHGEQNLEAIAASLARFGQAEPLIVQAATHRVIGGNGRLVAMRTLGWAECDVVELDLGDTEATALAIALNRTGELATWDEPVLARLLAGLRDEGILEGTGFDDGDVDEILAQLEAEEPPEIDDPGPEDPPDKPVSRAGDLWVLGHHRLLCGDSTLAEDVERVMDGRQAALCAIDPPFLVDYTGERPNDSGKDWTATYREIDIKDAEGFYRSLFTNALAVLAPHAAIYCWHAHKRQALLSRVWDELGILDHQQIIWVKPASVFGRVYWHFRHEPCVMGWRKGSKPEHDGVHDHDSVWEVDWAGKARVATDHPTSKPVELFARPMRKHTRPGDDCLELCSGSGSQIIAAEELGRSCRALEISPAFVDVAVRRWEQATGNAATLDGTDKTFEQVAGERSSS